MAKTMGVGPITGTIYYGAVKNDRWVGNREDVTDIAIRSVFEWFMYKFKAECREGEAYQVKFPSVPYVLEMRIEAEPSENNQLSRDEQSKGFISKQKLCNYIQAQINPYGKPFDGTAYEFGLKIMDYIRNSLNDEVESHEQKIRANAIDHFINKVFEQFTALEIEDSYATVTECKMVLRDVAEQMKETEVQDE